MTIQSKQANPGSVLVTNGGGTTFGTCQGPSSPGSVTCTIAVPSESPLALDALPATGEAWKAWKGYCGGMPGPVCLVFQGSKPHATTVVLGSAGRGPALTTSASVVYGNTPNCAFNDSLTVTGSKFPADAPATLTDDGTVVATGTTASNGTVSLGYTVSASEPSLYRSLVLTAGSSSATTDVGNILEVCLAGGATHTGTTNFIVGDSDNDANGTMTYTFGKNPSVPVDNDAAGAGSATTPNYTCPKGKTINERLSGSSAVGTKWAFHYSVTLPFTCP